MHSKKLSIIVPLYNVALYVHKAASSIASQAFEGLEVVLVDDGSTDYSLERFMEHLIDVDVVSIRQENAGPGGARNTGILNASGKYIMFLDGDDFLLPGAFRNILSMLENEKPTVLFGRYHLWTEKNGLALAKKVIASPPDDPKDRTEYILGGQPEASWGPVRYVCRRDFVLEQKIFFETDVLCEDVKWSIDLLMTIENHGGAISFLFEPFYAYNHRRVGSTMNTCTVKRLIDLNDVVTELLAVYTDRPQLCRILAFESFFYINEYCLFSRDERKQIIECYQKVLPLYHRSGSFILCFAGEFQNALLFYCMSLSLFFIKMARRTWIHVYRLMKSSPQIEVLNCIDIEAVTLQAEQLSTEQKRTRGNTWKVL